MHGQVRVNYGNNNAKVDIKTIEPVLARSEKYMQCNHGTRKKNYDVKVKNLYIAVIPVRKNLIDNKDIPHQTYKTCKKSDNKQQIRVVWSQLNKRGDNS